MDELQTILRTVNSGDMPHEIFADWLDEQGIGRDEVMPVMPLLPFDIYSFEILSGSGSGSGRGSGIGRGRGSGRGSGSGSGRGSGRGSGIGRGRGRGSGSGSGSGSGRGSGSGSGRGSIYMEIGKAYLVHCGDWHTFVGRVVRQISPYVYVMESVSKISDTNNGDNWQQLCEGNLKARKKATYLHYKVQATVPLTVVAFEWLGKLPQEEE